MFLYKQEVRERNRRAKQMKSKGLAIFVLSMKQRLVPFK